MLTNDTVKYTGLPDAVCPITFKPLSDIILPVVFRHDPRQPYEAEALAEWLVIRPIIPHSNIPCEWMKSPAEIVAPITGTCLEPRQAMTFFHRIKRIYPWEKCEYIFYVLVLYIIIELRKFTNYTALYDTITFAISITYLGYSIMRDYPVYGPLFLGIYFITMSIMLPMAYYTGLIIAKNGLLSLHFVSSDLVLSKLLVDIMRNIFHVRVS